jgi:dihydrofolate reductase
MSMLRVHNFVVTLDGYSTGEDRSTQAAFGTAQTEFSPWFGKAHVWRSDYQPGGEVFVPSLNESIAAASGSGVGADIIGGNMYRPATGPWPEGGWRGWWGEEPPFGTPCFVMSHREQEPLTVGHTTFYFINGTPAEVLHRALEAAGGLDVRLGGGPTTVNEFLAAGLVDYLPHHPDTDHPRARCTPMGWSGATAQAVRCRSVTVPNGTTHFFFTKNH